MLGRCFTKSQRIARNARFYAEASVSAFDPLNNGSEFSARGRGSQCYTTILLHLQLLC
jgi:hypothetical protein